MPPQRAQKTPDQIAAFIQAQFSKGADPQVLRDTLTPAELQLGINILEAAEKRQALREGPPVEGGAFGRFAGGATEIARGLGGIAKDVATGAFGANPQALQRVAALPGQFIGAQADQAVEGFKRLRESFGFNRPTTELTERGEQGRVITGFPAEPPPQSAGLEGIQGALQLLTSPIPFSPAAIAPGESISRGDVAGGLGQFIGLAAPKLAASAAARVKPRVIPDPAMGAGTVDFTTPSGQKIPIGQTKSELATGFKGDVFEGVESLARSSRVSKGALDRFDTLRDATFIDDVVPNVLADITPVPGTPKGRGAAAKRGFAGEKGSNAAVLEEGQRGRAVLRENVIDRSIVGPNPRLKAALEEALPERVGAQEVLPLPSNKTTITNIEAGLDVVGGRRGSVDAGTAQLIKNIEGTQRRSTRGGNTEIEVFAEQQLTAALEGKVTPVADQLTMLKFLKAEGRRIEKAGSEGLDVGLNKQKIAALQADIEATLRPVPGTRAPEGARVGSALGPGESAARDFTAANQKIRKGSNRPRQEPFKSLERVNTEDVPGLLNTVDIRDIPKLRAGVGKERFDAIGRQLLEDNLGITEPIPGSSLTGTALGRSRSITSGPLNAHIEKMKGGRGDTVYGKASFAAQKALAAAFTQIQKAKNIGNIVLIGRSIDAAAFIAIPALVIGALATGGLGAAAFGTAAVAMAPAIMLRIFSKVATTPKGAGIWRNYVKAIGTGKEAFWAARLGDFIDNDPELKPLLDQRREELQQQQ